MGGLFGALNGSLSALEAFQNALEVAQNNVSNASTPGYASQNATFEAQRISAAERPRRRRKLRPHPIHE